MAPTHVAKILIEKGMEVEGAIYPPAPLNAFLSQLCIYALFGLIALMFIGEQLFKVARKREEESMDFEPGAKIVAMLKNNFYASVMIAFVLNTLAQQLVATGAFEIEIDNETVFSKIATGRIPTPDILENLAKTYAAATALFLNLLVPAVM
eukprot:jgi/Bigna1/75932/fgenesh1_pg.38_\